MTQNPQRYSGRELGQLLAQVRDELGEDATILEANRLREGGIGGFFSKERFEVVATAGQQDDAGTEPAGVAATAAAGAAPSGQLHVDHLLDRADRVSGDERRAARGADVPAAGLTADARFEELLRGALVDLTDGPAASATIAPVASRGDGPGLDGLGAAASAPAAPADAPTTPPAAPDLAAAHLAGPAPSVPARPVAPAAPPAHQPMAAAPAQPPAPPLPGPAATAPTVPHASAPPPPPPPPPPAPAPAPAPADVRYQAVAGGAGAGWPSEAPTSSDGRRHRAPAPHRAPLPAAADAPAAGFWSDVVRFERLVDETPLAADVTTVVGPLADAVALGRQIAQQAGIDHGDLVVFSDQGPVDGVPPWQVVDQRDELAERVSYWRSNGRRAVVVVDLEPGERGLQRTARAAAAADGDLTRLVVTDLDDPTTLAATLRGLGPVGAIDVSRSPRPAGLVAAVEQGIRIGSVCGRPLTAVLLAGLAAAADHG